MQKILYSGLMMLIVTACATTPPTQSTAKKICLAEPTQNLVGKKHISTAEIQQLTHAEIVRISYPGQAITMDYRDNRVTLLIDPDSQMVLRASCG